MGSCNCSEEQPQLRTPNTSNNNSSLPSEEDSGVSAPYIRRTDGSAVTTASVATDPFFPTSASVNLHRRSSSAQSVPDNSSHNDDGGGSHRHVADDDDNVVPMIGGAGGGVAAAGDGDNEEHAAAVSQQRLSASIDMCHSRKVSTSLSGSGSGSRSSSTTSSGKNNNESCPSLGLPSVDAPFARSGSPPTSSRHRQEEQHQHGATPAPLCIDSGNVMMMAGDAVAHHDVLPGTVATTDAAATTNHLLTPPQQRPPLPRGDEKAPPGDDSEISPLCSTEFLSSSNHSHASNNNSNSNSRHAMHPTLQGVDSSNSDDDDEFVPAKKKKKQNVPQQRHKFAATAAGVASVDDHEEMMRERSLKSAFDEAAPAAQWSPTLTSFAPPSRRSSGCSYTSSTTGESLDSLG